MSEAMECLEAIKMNRQVQIMQKENRHKAALLEEYGEVKIELTIKMEEIRAQLEAGFEEVLRLQAAINEIER